ncbi:fatty acid desaturase [Pseudomonas sp. NPDC007930]|uniref:fatty acid desaturase family protein n=1 Tax=Pseudomonas sp. NPDC007930 TaxID=3364417 RepID=UPI0036F034D9
MADQTAFNGAAARRDYRLTGAEAQRALDRGLASAQWYQCPVPRKRMKELMQRSDARAARDLGLWLVLLVATASGAVLAWGSLWCVPWFIAYGVLYGTMSNPVWHETGHGTAFKTRWLNNAFYQLACFMIGFEPDRWRWSHARHHTDTIVVGRDPEIVEPRPPHLWKMALSLFQLPHLYALAHSLLRHAGGRLSAEEQLFIPRGEWPRVYRTARVWLAIHAAVVALALWQHSWLPVLLVGLPTVYGGWLSYVFGLSQHVGLAEDELDHRSNCRTIYMNPVLRFLYLNMNYHLEHHMFPMVPYYRLAELHEEIRGDCPPPYPSLWAAYKEILHVVWRQQREPGYFIRRPLPTPTPTAEEAAA